MSSIDDIGFPKELLQNPARIRLLDEFLFGFERIMDNSSRLSLYKSLTSPLVVPVALLSQTLKEKFTIKHDDGNQMDNINKSDIILLGVSRTSKTPTAIYLANRGFKTSNIPLVNKESLPNILKKNPKLTCIVGLTTEPERLVDIRRNRMTSLKEKENINYTDFEKISKEVEEAKKIFKKYNWPTVDVTRKSVEETAASVIKIYEIEKEND